MRQQGLGVKPKDPDGFHGILLVLSALLALIVNFDNYFEDHYSVTLRPAQDAWTLAFLPKSPWAFC